MQASGFRVRGLAVPELQAAKALGSWVLGC